LTILLSIDISILKSVLSPYPGLLLCIESISPIVKNINSLPTPNISPGAPPDLPWALDRPYRTRGTWDTKVVYIYVYNTGDLNYCSELCMVDTTIYVYSTYTYMHINLKPELQRIGSRHFIQLIQYAIWPYCWPLRFLEVIFQPSRTIYDYFDHIDPP
jgi:hypothetical protein